MIFLITGHSGVGKGYLIERLAREYPKRFTISQNATTRVRRAKDNPVNRVFMSEADFAKLEQAGEFLFVEEFAGAKYGWYKHQPASTPDQLTEVFPYMMKDFLTLPNSVPVILRCTDYEFLAEHMRRRGDSAEKIAERIKIAKDVQPIVDEIVGRFGEHGKVFDVSNDSVIETEVMPWILQHK